MIKAILENAAALAVFLAFVAIAGSADAIAQFLINIIGW